MRSDPRSVVIALVWIALGCTHSRVATINAEDTFSYSIIRRIPHDTAAHTQGLVFANNVLYESTGRLGKSQLRLLDPITGKVLAAVDLPEHEYAEGLTLINDLLYLATWRNHVMHLYDARTLRHIRTMPYTGEAWGLTTNGTSLILSNGSATLRYLSAATLSVEREIRVRDRGWAIGDLNELEFAGNEIFANILLTDQVIRIDPHTGSVLGWINLAPLLPGGDRSADRVLNGIAYEPRSRHLFVTGKGWPTIFEIRLTARGTSAIGK